MYAETETVDTRSRLADTCLPIVNSVLAFAMDPTKHEWSPENCAIMPGNTYRVVTGGILIVDSCPSGVLPTGALILEDRLRSNEWSAYCLEHNLPGKGAGFGNVHRQGLLSLGRALQHIGEKGLDRLAHNVQVAERLMNTFLMESYTLDTTSREGVSDFEANLLKVADLFETRGNVLKQRIREYIQRMIIRDILDRTNVERLPLMFMKATRFIQELKHMLAHWESEVDERRDAVADLNDALLMRARDYRIIACQARNSHALLVDEGQVANKDNAVLAWPHYRDALNDTLAEPYAGWFHRMGKHYGLAIEALSLHDMSGLPATRHMLEVVDASGRVPDVMNMIDAVTLEASRARDSNEPFSIPARTALAHALGEARHTLGSVEDVLKTYDASFDRTKLWEVTSSVSEAQKILNPLNDVAPSENNVNTAYEYLIHANNCLRTC